MGGFFGVASKKDCILELFYGVDYHSHLGTRRGGMAAYGGGEFCRAIHNIENSPFRTKFERDVEEMKGNLGIGCISDYEPQPLLIQSHHGSFAIVTVGKINNEEELLRRAFNEGHSHFQEMSGGKINATELVASLICKKASLVEGIRYAQKIVDGSLTLLLMTKDGLYAARDRYGRTPLVIGRKEDAYCVSFENFAYINLGYTDYRELGPGEVAFITPEGVETLVEPGDSIFLGVGTTVQAMAQYLKNVPNLTAFTNSLRTAVALSELADCSVVLTGGQLRTKELSLSGFPAEENMLHFNVNKAFLGIGGITEAGVTDFHIGEAKLHRQMIQNADQAVVLADFSKFGVRGMTNVCPLSMLDSVVTDRGTAPKYLEQLEQAGIQVILAD